MQFVPEGSSLACAQQHTQLMQLKANTRAIVFAFKEWVLKPFSACNVVNDLMLKNSHVLNFLHFDIYFFCCHFLNANE